MAELVIRYCNGKRTMALDFRGGPSRLECVLHDKTREHRIAIPKSL
jgi:hypothetical protein